MKTVRILVCGFGRVGRAVIELIHTRSDLLHSEYGIRPRLAAVVDIDGTALAPSDGELPPGMLLELPRGTGPSALQGYGHPGMTALEVIRSGVADVLVETTPTNIRDGEPGMTHITEALTRGMHVVTASKGPLVLALDRLQRLARDHGVSLKFSAATAAALPALDVGTYCLAGATITRIEGILNGTTNFILSRMQEQGEGYAEALAEAQRLGIAETDPTLDVGGWDSANKLLLLANALMGAGLTLDDVQVSGITGVRAGDLRAAGEKGQTLKLVALAEPDGGKVTASVGVRALEADHPLAHVMGAEKAVTYTTDTMDRITVMGGKSDPRGAAAAILKDLIHIAQEYTFPGGQL